MWTGHRKSGIGSRPKGSSGRMVQSTMDCWIIAKTMGLRCKSHQTGQMWWYSDIIFSWSYNQGVVLGGLVELNKAAPNSSYLKSANDIAKAAIETLVDSNGVLHEFCEPDDCEPNATQFKGIFIRNLLMLQSVSPHDSYKRVITSSADSIWKNDRSDQNRLGVVWSGPVVSTVDPSTHCSAMDALVAAIAV